MKKKRVKEKIEKAPVRERKETVKVTMKKILAIKNVRKEKRIEKIAVGSVDVTAIVIAVIMKAIRSEGERTVVEVIVRVATVLVCLPVTAAGKKNKEKNRKS